MNKKKLGLLSIILLGMNAIIGSGIFLLPNQAYSLVGKYSLGIILFDAVLVISIALCFAEASSLFKSNGGPYVYAKEAFGNFVGFEVGFIKWIVSMIAWATMSNAFATALGQVSPTMNTRPMQIIVMSSIIIILSAANLIGVSQTKWLNNIVTIFKLAPLLLFIAVGIFYIQGDNLAITTVHLTPSNFGKGAILLFYAFTGFESIAVAAEDMDNPQKNIPKAIILVMIAVSIFYFLIQLVAIGVLGTKLADYQAPIQQAMNTMLGKTGLFIVAAGTLISIGGINIASSFITPRSAVALANDGLLPKFMAKKSKNNVPYWAIIITAIITLPIALSGSFTTLAAISVVSRFAQYIPTVLSIMVFRKTKAHAQRSFKVPFGITIPIIATITSIWLLFQATIEQLLLGFGGLIIAIPFYFIMRRLNKTK